VLGSAAGEAAHDLLGLGGARRRAVVYFTIWSYCWRIRSRSIVSVDSTGAKLFLCLLAVLAFVGLLAGLAVLTGHA
jgi:hypothetical protein